MSKVNDRQRQHDQADSLIQKLERIRELWEEAPGHDDLEDLARAANGIAQGLEEARKAFNAPDFPTFDSLKSVCQRSWHLGDNAGPS